MLGSTTESCAHFVYLDAWPVPSFAVLGTVLAANARLARRRTHHPTGNMSPTVTTAHAERHRHDYECGRRCTESMGTNISALSDMTAETPGVSTELAG